MNATIRTISPIDGSLHAERPAVADGAVAAALAAARAALRDWAVAPLAERARICLAAVDAMLAMEAEIVPELAWQMGRPVRYGGGELRGFAERARAMVALAPASLADIDPGPKEGFSRFIRR